jgi:hypothetical protein
VTRGERSCLAVVVAAATVAAVAPATDAVPVRGARVADAAPREAWVEWWRLHGIEPRTGRHFVVEIQTRGSSELELRMNLLDPGPFEGASGADLVERREGTLLDVASLTRGADGWRLVVDHRIGKARLRVRGRPGVTVGPWRLGWHPVYNADPPRRERASLSWSALVPAGRVDGWVAWGDFRFDVTGWHAYLEHTWGRFRDFDGTWDHWDRVVSHRGPGESWVLQGLEVRPGGPMADPGPHDRLWRGVLVHATPRGITTCRPTVRRSGWWYLNGPTNPSVIVATCNGRSITFRSWQASFRQKLLADRSGFIDHRVNFIRIG